MKVLFFGVNYVDKAYRIIRLTAPLWIRAPLAALYAALSQVCVCADSAEGKHTPQYFITLNTCLQSWANQQKVMMKKVQVREIHVLLYIIHFLSNMCTWKIPDPPPLPPQPPTVTPRGGGHWGIPNPAKRHGSPPSWIHWTSPRWWWVKLLLICYLYPLCHWFCSSWIWYDDRWGERSLTSSCVGEEHKHTRVRNFHNFTVWLC